jgi:hypothetical protein
LREAEKLPSPFIAWPGSFNEKNGVVEPDQAPLRAEKCLVVMFNRALKTYIETTLPELKIRNATILTYGQWTYQLLNDMVGPRPTQDLNLGRNTQQFKSSSICLDLLHRYIGESPTKMLTF